MFWDPAQSLGQQLGWWPEISSYRKGVPERSLRTLPPPHAHLQIRKLKTWWRVDAYLFINSAMIYWAHLQGPMSGAGENREGCCFQGKTYTVNSHRRLVNGGTVQRAQAWELQVLSSNPNRHFVSELSDLLSFGSSSLIWGGGVWPVDCTGGYEHPDNHSTCWCYETCIY